MRKIVSFASTPNEAIKWSELGKYKRLSKEELYIYDFENIEEVHFIGSKKGENDYEIEETKWGIYINMEEAILLYICSWQTKEFQLLEKINKNYITTYMFKIDDQHTCIRLVTSWATSKEICEQFIEEL